MIASALSIGMLALGWAGFESVKPQRTEGVRPGRLPTPFLRFQPDQPPEGTAVLVHGLSANKEFMQILAMALCDAGYEVLAIDLPGHGDSPLRFSYSGSLDAIRSFLDGVEGDPVVVGHSLGAALLAELASTRRFRSLILISPPPIPLEPFLDGQVLVLSGASDAPGVNEFIPELIDAAGPDAEWWLFPDATHSTTLFDPSKLQSIAGWMHSSTAPGTRTASRIGWLALMVLGGLAAPLFLAGIGTERGAEPGSTDWTSELVRWAASLGVTLVALRFVALFEWLHLFAADYLIGSLLLVGLLLWKGRRTSMTLAGTLVGILGAAYVIGVFLCLVGSELMHLVPSGTQWLRLPVLTAAGLPLCLHDEQVFRPVRPWWKRWLFFALTRSLLWAAVVTGVLLFNPPSAFLVLIMHFVVVFWLVVWWMAGFVARRTGEPGAAALFTSLVQGWVFAAVFVRI